LETFQKIPVGNIPDIPVGDIPGIPIEKKTFQNIPVGNIQEHSRIKFTPIFY
jgi:hypothetical protein